MKRFILTLTIIFCSLHYINAQSSSGQLWGSFESTSMYYVKDSKLKKVGPYFWTKDKDQFASNNYLKLDYNRGNFTAGIQLESYLPVLEGFEFDNDYKRFFLGSKYIQWQDKGFFVRVGNIYEQFGSGIIFRSYEDRALGINNSIEGVMAKYSYNNILELKTLAGRPRYGTRYLDTWVRGADLTFSIADACKLDKILLSVEGSYINRYESLTNPGGVNFGDYGLTTPHLNMYSGRLNIGYEGITLKGEYVRKQNMDYNSSVTGEEKDLPKGNAWLAELGINKKSFALLATFRKLESMETLASKFENGMYNTINYLPSLTRQYTYSLANLNPYMSQTNGELGGQVDAYYSLKQKSKYWNFHVNFSTFYTLKKKAKNKNAFLWRDINFDVDRQWNRTLKTSFLYSRQEYDPDKGYEENPSNVVSNIFVADLTKKFNKKLSLRAELQYLYAEKEHSGEKDWVAASVEVSFAPRWNIFVSDMLDIERNFHYYNGGFSYSHGNSRCQLSYGRTKGGYVCSGGVCRNTPQYTGLNLIFTTAF